MKLWDFFFRRMQIKWLQNWLPSLRRCKNLKFVDVMFQIQFKVRDIVTNFDAVELTALWMIVDSAERIPHSDRLQNHGALLLPSEEKLFGIRKLWRENCIYRWDDWHSLLWKWRTIFTRNHPEAVLKSVLKPPIGQFQLQSIYSQDSASGSKVKITWTQSRYSIPQFILAKGRLASNPNLDYLNNFPVNN